MTLLLFDEPNAVNYNLIRGFGGIGNDKDAGAHPLHTHSRAVRRSARHENFARRHLRFNRHPFEVLDHLRSLPHYANRVKS